MKRIISNAPNWKRILAKIFDYIILISIFFSSKLFLKKFFQKNLNENEDVILQISYLITVLGLFLFQVIFPFFLNGKTIGKIIFCLKTINKKNKKLSLFFFIVREVFIFLPFFLIPYFLFIIKYFNLNENEMTYKFFLKLFSLFFSFWLIFIFIFQKINPLNRLFYDKIWDAVVVNKNQKLIIEKKIFKIKNELIIDNKKMNNNNNILNKNQIIASEISKNINLRIIAGPGTGKTTVLVYRILNLIEIQNVCSNKILVLTFTKKACENIKNNIKKKISWFEGKQIFTYHGFCYKFLLEEKNNLIDFKNKKLSILDSEDQKILIKKISEFEEIKIDKIFIKYFLTFLKIYRMKIIKKNFKDVDKILKETFSKKEFFYFSNLRNEYEKYKKENGLLDFDDLLFETYKNLKLNNDLLIKYKRRFSQIIIDEFQDTSLIQYLIIKLLSNNGIDIKLSVVGDPDQTIYTWRDAAIEHIIDFDKNFKNVKTIILDKNYRSTKNIVKLANLFILNNKNRIKKEIVSTKEIGTKIELLIDSQQEQVEEIVLRTKKLLDNGINPNDISIVYRSHYLSGIIEKELILNKVPYYIFKGIRFFSRKEIKDLLLLCSIFVKNNNFELEQVILWSKNIGFKTLESIKNAAKKENIELFDYLKIISEKPKFNKIASNINEIFEEIFILKKNIKEIKSFGFFINFVFEKIYFKFLERFYLNFEERIKNINSLIDIIESFEKKNSSLSLEEIIFKFLNEIKISVTEDFIEKKRSINLMTVHNTKGLEFDHVFIFNVSKNIFPSIRSKTLNQIEEERRLMFVAITRARKTLFITSDYNYSIFVKDIQNTRLVKII